MKKSPPMLWEVPRYKLSTDAHPDLCNRCHAAIWKLICQTGFTVKLDTNRLNVSEQIETYLQKVPMYEIRKTAESFMASLWIKQRILASRHQNIILAGHRCGAILPIPTSWPDYWPKPEIAQTDGIPF